MQDTQKEQPTLADLLPPEVMSFGVEAADWRAAIGKAGELLAAAGATTDAYTGQMIAAVERYGPYIVIAPGFALAHAQASESVVRTGLSWVQLASPVEFGHKSNDPVRLVVGLASHSHEAHRNALQQLGALLSKPATLAQLQDASTPAQLQSVLELNQR